MTTPPLAWLALLAALLQHVGAELKTVENGQLAVDAWRAEDFDTLVDSPLYAGNATIHRFEVAGRQHLLVNEGEDGVWDGPRSAADPSVQSGIRTVG